MEIANGRDEFKKFFFFNSQQQAFQAFRTTKLTNTGLQRKSNKQRHGNIVWTSSHDMTTNNDQYQYGSVRNVLLFQS